MFRLWWILACSPMVFGGQSTHFNSTEFGSLLYEKKGNISVAGVFSGRFGNDCSADAERRLEEIISAIWTVEVLNAYKYLPGLTIGLLVFDICELSNNQNAIEKIAEELSRFDEDTVNVDIRFLSIWVICLDILGTSFEGIITTLENYKKLATSESLPDRNIVRIKRIISGDVLSDITIQLLINLRWMNVSILFSDSFTVTKSFREKASEEGICVRSVLLVNSSDSDRQLRSLSNGSKTSVVVVIASFAQIVFLTKKFHKVNISLILTPIDFVFDLNLVDLPKNTIVTLPSVQDRGVLLGQLENMRRRKDFFIRQPPIRGPSFIETAATVLHLLRPLRKALAEKCRDKNPDSEKPCASVPDFMTEIKGNKTSLLSHESMKISPDDVEEALKVLKIEPSANDEMFLCIASVVNANTTEDFAIFQVFNLQLKTLRPVLLMINDEALRVGSNVADDSERDTHERHQGDMQNKSSRIPAAGYLQEFTPGKPEGIQVQAKQSERDSSGENTLEKNCVDVRCRDSETNLTAPAVPSNSTSVDGPRVVWRFLTWVSVNTSLGFVGVTCTFSIMLFVIIKLCKDDFLEGSPHFTLLLMVAVVLMYMSSLPFHMEFQEEWFICIYRKSVPPVVFAVLFSLLLSRSLMVALSEAAGELDGHINGYLQSVLCFFMIGVQASITSQNWTSGKSIRDVSCTNTDDKYNIIFTLVYDSLLLILLACVSPFIIRSKRSCKEGLLFSISVLFITVVWSAWISFYVLLPSEHKNAAIAVGLNATATVLLLCVFIPQMYFMAAPFAHDETIRSLSSLDRHVLAGGSHADYKSSQALNECAFGTYKNCETGCTNPSFQVSQQNGGGNPVAPHDLHGESFRDVPEATQRH